ncbi:MAG: aspartyl protease family protein [Cyclobacteriaceae bacterium]
MKRLLFVGIFCSGFGLFAQDELVSVPFELYGDHIFIKLNVDGSEPQDFIFDTGDGLTVLDIDVAKSLGLDLDHKQQTSSAQGTITGALIKHNRIDVGGLQMEKNVKIYATSLKHLEISIGRNVDGIIGYDLLQHHAVNINYDNMTFNVYDPSVFPTDGVKIPIKMVSGIPTVQGSVTLNDGNTIEGIFYVNTGAGTTMDFNTPFATANDIISKTGQHYSYPVKGLGDVESMHYEGRVASFSVGNVRVDQMPIGISQVNSGLQGDKRVAGIIGNRLLKQYNVTVDIKSSSLYLSPNQSAGAPIPVNCSGLDVQMNEEQSDVLIHRVFEGSSAEEAGISVNDILVQIDGMDASELGLMNVRKILKTPGKMVKLTLKSARDTKEVELMLKELI